MLYTEVTVRFRDGHTGKRTVRSGRVLTDAYWIACSPSVTAIQVCGQLVQSEGGRVTIHEVIRARRAYLAQLDCIATMLGVRLPARWYQ